MGWEFVKLGDLVHRKIGYGIVQPGANVDVGVPVIKVNNIISGLSNIELLEKTTTDIDARYTRTRLLGGELVISLVGSVGKTAIVPKTFAGCNLVRATGLIDIKDEILAKWVKYYIDSPQGQAYINSNVNTTVQVTLNIKSLSDMPIPLPDHAIREKIVAILSSLDDKIELNRRINANLEQQAQALFDEYFIHNIGKLGNYSTASLTDIAQFLNGLAMQKFRPKGNEDGIPVLKIKELGQGKCDASSDLCSSSIPKEYIINNGDIVFSWSGTLLVDIWCSGICGLNQHLFKVLPLNYPKWLIYFWTKYHLSNFIRIAQDKAVTMGHIKRGDLDAAKVIIPSAESLNELDKIMSPMLQSIISNRIENNNLSILRDTLLPKLMSGEITV